jgi:GT2 family glycosyltransferase
MLQFFQVALHLLNLDAIKEIGMYDDALFMYFEDWDLSGRMYQYYKTIYFPFGIQFMDV